MTASVRITSDPFDPEGEAARFRTRLGEGRAGAIVTFTGTVRGLPGEGTRLVLSHYEGYTDRVIGRFVSGAIDRFSLLGVVVVHRVGEMAPGTPIVFVATATAHRRAAFEACDFLMDHLKQRAPFWKKEAGPEGARWIEPTLQDRTDLKRWE
ncbi:molybdenum cofactor biosynthesis protein MoaE [Parvularcula sp. LCG005]|uniref:molybdenum cofactor biosynthesis protein MoaE n=1 Tax=Parvularcula sp. LCG005 TaxID=3078805 RepID=UPI0029434887|nr:molybdenum cofactor biosynthesis protein MoaE [Parvularcula sp. LCG005]WOI52211.1 molybdenum cofactor biosynthesis protein MoaE [Parvularcula sp. LCG005]